MKPALSPLRLPGFARLAFAYTINEVGNWLGLIGLPILVYDRTGSIAATVGLFLALEFLPALVGPAMVARLEVSGTRVALPLLYVGGAAAYLALAALSESGALALIFVLAAVDGSLGLTGRALTRAATASLLKPAGLLREGNAITNVGFTVAFAVGPALAGIVIAIWSVQTALLIDAASFCIGAVLLLGRSIPNVKAEPERWLARIRAGLSYVKSRPLLARLLAAQTVALIFLTAATPVELIFAKQTLDAGDFGYGLLVTAWGAGTVAGGLVFAAVRRVSVAVLLGVSTALIGLSFLGFAASPTLAIACAVAAIGGVGNGVQWIAAMSSLQALCSTEFQARVVSLLESASSLMPGLGFLVGGAVVALASTRAAFVVAGAGVLAVCLAAGPLLYRAGIADVDGLEPPSGEAAGTMQEGLEAALSDPGSS